MLTKVLIIMAMLCTIKIVMDLTLKICLLRNQLGKLKIKQLSRFFFKIRGIINNLPNAQTVKSPIK